MSAAQGENLSHVEMDRQPIQPSPTSIHSPRSPSSAPSAACHDSSDDAEPTGIHKQKRPRLDSGSRAVRSISADTILSPSIKDSDSLSDTALPTSAAFPSPNKITIHVRPTSTISPLPSYGDGSSNTMDQQDITHPHSDTSSTIDHIDHIDHDDIENDQSNASPDASQTESVQSTLALPASDEPPYIESQVIDIDQPQVPGESAALPIEVDALDDGSDAMDAVHTVEIDDDDLVHNFLYSFPYLQTDQKPIQAAKMIYRHLDQPIVDPDLIPKLLDWFDLQSRTFAGQRHHSQDLFATNLSLWNQVGAIMNKICHRE